MIKIQHSSKGFDKHSKMIKTHFYSSYSIIIGSKNITGSHSKVLYLILFALPIFFCQSVVILDRVCHICTFFEGIVTFLGAMNDTLV